MGVTSAGTENESGIPWKASYVVALYFIGISISLVPTRTVKWKIKLKLCTSIFYNN